MRRSIVSLATAIGLAGFSGGAMVQPAPTVRHMPAESKRKRGLFNDVVLPDSGTRIGRRHSPGTVAQAKRKAVKAKNVKRHRKACRA